jgi:hypothetical protein
MLVFGDCDRDRLDTTGTSEGLLTTRDATIFTLGKNHTGTGRKRTSRTTKGNCKKQLEIADRKHNFCV